MRFSKRMLRAVVSSVFMIALLGPLVTVSHAQQTHAQQRHDQQSNDLAPDVFMFGVETDTSEVEEFFSNATRIEDVFDAADAESTMATDAIVAEMPITFPQKYSAKISPRFLGVAGPNSDRQDADNSFGTYTTDQNDHNIDLSEGAFVPPTVGRFVLLQNRWSFVPDNPASAVVVQETEIDTSTLENTFRAASAIKHLRAQIHSGVELVPSNPLRNGESDRETLLSQLGTKRNEAVMSTMNLTQLVVAENLMLERVVDSIQSDNAGDRWVVSGYITELRDGNQIELRSAKPSRR